MPYWRLHYHLTWSTHRRRPLLDAHNEVLLKDTLHDAARALSVFIHQVGCGDDHAHVVASIPPTLPVAECVKQLKGASSRALNAAGSCPGAFRWQAEYGAITVSEEALPRVIRYVRRQRRHHRRAGSGAARVWGRAGLKSRAQ